MKTHRGCRAYRKLAGSVAVGTLTFCSTLVAIPPNVERGRDPFREVPLTDADSPATRVPSIGVSVPVESSAIYPVVGGDNCNDATVVPVAVGPSGSPNTVTITGDTTPATGPECSGYAGPFWWEAFEIDSCAILTIDFCGTSPVLMPAYIGVWAGCAPDGSTCGPYLAADGYSREWCPDAGDENITIVFDALPAGAYYYPLIADPGRGLGPYIMHVTAEACTGACTGCLGACCDSSIPTCTNDVLQAACVGPTEEWLGRARCCEMECRAPGPEYDALDVELLSHVPNSSFPSGSLEANDIWGYVSPRGRKYALLGLDSGTGFVDITDPRSPMIVADIPDSHSIWSDMAVHGEYAYNVNEASGGMQVIDLTQIDDGIVTLIGAVTGGLQTAHNVYVNPESAYAYPCGTNVSTGTGFLAFDLSDPANPVFAGAFDDVYFHDLYVVNYDACPIDPPDPRGGQPCEIAFGFAGEFGLYIVDVTNKNNMTTIATINYPTVAYCHQGWLSEDRRHVYFNDELDELYSNVTQTRTYIVDVQNLANPILVDTFDHPGCWIDHNLIPRGNRIYHAHYAAGLRVVDASDPFNLSEVAYFDSHPESNVQGFVGAWGVFPGFPVRLVAISDIERGLFVLCDEPDRSIPGFVIDQNPRPSDEPFGFDAASSTTCDPSRTLVSYEWDFDYDGASFDVNATGTTATHIYGASGVRTVALRVTDDLSAQEITTLDITALVPIPAVSEWGLVAMTLLLLAAGTLVVRRYVRARA